MPSKMINFKILTYLKVRSTRIRMRITSNREPFKYVWVMVVTMKYFLILLNADCVKSV